MDIKWFVYYERKMPQNGWKLLQNTPSRERTTMRFSLYNNYQSNT